MPTCDGRPSLNDVRYARDILRREAKGASGRVATALEAILAGTDAVRAFGLRSRAGQRSALTIDRLHRRDRLIREIASRHFPGMPAAEQARRIIDAASVYQRRLARLDLEVCAMPASYAGTPREFLFHIARIPAEVPKYRTVRAIISRPVEPLHADTEDGLFAATAIGD